jgi:hypothetical protein
VETFWVKRRWQSLPHRGSSDLMSGFHFDADVLFRSMSHHVTILFASELPFETKRETIYRLINYSN